MRFKYITQNPLARCIEYDGGDFEDFMRCLKKNKLMVAIAGTSCAGKSLVLQDLIGPKAKFLQEQAEDEEAFSAWGITTTNMALKETEITDVIMKRRNPYKLAKCLNEERRVFPTGKSKDYVWTPKAAHEWQNEIEEKARKFRLITVNDI